MLKTNNYGFIQILEISVMLKLYFSSAVTPHHFNPNCHIIFRVTFLVFFLLWTLSYVRITSIRSKCGITNIIEVRSNSFSDPINPATMEAEVGIGALKMSLKKIIRVFVAVDKISFECELQK
ncbi:hypothetical protein T09_12915 [Trichinella sp. T9]|nr:hypothetical protein T09_12915 [Trichinella sp. T9]